MHLAVSFIPSDLQKRN